MTLCVLISCMHQNDMDIVQRTNVQTDAVVVNQCDKNQVDRYTFMNKYGKECKVCFVNTTERGLSKSRNMAMQYAAHDICLICDDDEYLHDSYENTILNAYQQHPFAGVIAFSLIRKDCNKTYPAKPCKLGFRQIFKTSSLQITFNLNLLINSGISFDEKMGSGTGNGGGEENKILLDCRHKKFIMYYNPNCIATVLPGESQWFAGYTDKYFENLGWSSRHLLGAGVGLIYGCYNLLTHRHLYSSDNTMKNAAINMIRGWKMQR